MFFIKTVNNFIIHGGLVFIIILILTQMYPAIRDSEIYPYPFVSAFCIIFSIKHVIDIYSKNSNFSIHKIEYNSADITAKILIILSVNELVSIYSSMKNEE